MSKTIQIQMTRGLLALLTATALGCGGGGGGSNVFTPLGAVGSAGTHVAALGPLAGATVRVSPVNMPEMAIVKSTTGSNGQFNLDTTTIPAQYDNTLLLVSVSGGNDIDANDDGVTDATPTPNSGTLNALVLGSDLKKRSISVSVLTEAVYRAVNGQMDAVPQEAVIHSMEEIAYQLLNDDIDGDGVISYGDVLSFNPTRAADKAKLAVNYNNIFVAQNDGTSLVDKFHSNNTTLIPTGVNAIFGTKTISKLPDQQDTENVIVNVSSGNGGKVESPDVPGMELGSGNRSYTYQLKKQTSTFTGGKVTFKATADDGFAFVRWVGCEAPAQVLGDTCVVQNATDNFSVSAQFKVNQNVLADGITGHVTLIPAPGKLGVTIDANNVLTLTSLDNDQINKVTINAIVAGNLIDTGLDSMPQVTIQQDLGANPIAAAGNTPAFYRKRFQVQSINLLDAYKQATFMEEDKPLEMKDLTAVRYIAPEITDVQKSIMLPTSANRTFIEGPSPSGVAGAQGSCPVVTDEETYATLNNGSGDQAVIACIAQDAQTVSSASACQPTESVVTTVDGRIYCVPQQQGTAEVEPQYNGAPNALAALDQRYKGSFMQANYARQGKGHHYDVRVTAPLGKKGRSAGKPMHVAKEVILVGFGKAYDLGNNVFLTNNPDKPGLMFISGEDVKPATPKQRAREIMKVVCSGNKHLAGCGQFGGSAVSTVATFSFPAGTDPLTFEISKGVYTLTVKARLELEARSAASATWILPLRFEANTSGFVRLTPTLGVGYQASKALLEDVKKTLYEFDFTKASLPAGAAFKGTFAVDVGVELNATIAAESTLSLPIVTRYDGEVAAGWGCRKSFFRDCDGGTRFGFKVVPSIYYTATLKGSATGVIEPYLQLGLYGGLRGVADRIFTVATRAFVQGEVAIEGPTFQVSNEPATLSRIGQKFCIDGTGGVKGTVYAGLRVFVETSTLGTPLEKIYKYNYKYTAFEKKYHIASYGWDFARDGKPFPKMEDVGFNIKPVVDSPLCSGTADANTPEERVYKAGELELQPTQFVSTKNRRLDMQEDGNLVVYEYDSSSGKEGNARFATGTNTGFNYRAIFQRDGNLVVYDLRGNPKWASNTSGLNNATLKMQKDGNIVIYRDNGSAAWATNTQ